MRILLLADLHGNRPATEALERAMPALHADEVWYLGDAVGKGPDSDWTCDWVRTHCDHFIAGNWDTGISGREFSHDQFYWDQLGEERMAWLASLPLEGELTLSGLTFRLFHGRPVTELMQVQMDSTMLGATFTAHGKKYDGVIFADSHRPFFRTLHEGYIMNTGSVGNSTGVPRAHCLLLEGGPDQPLLSTIVSVPYDREQAVADAMAKPDLPGRENWIREITTGVYSR